MKDIEQLIKELEQGLEQLNQLYAYRDHTSTDKFCDDMQKKGFDFSKEQVITKYQECYHLDDLVRFFYNRDQELWSKIEKSNDLFDHELLSLFIHKIIEENFDMLQVGDVSYIEGFMLELDPRMKKEDYRQGMINYLKMVIAYYERTKEQTICDKFQRIKFSEFLKQDLKSVDEMDEELKDLINKVKSCFKDV